MPRGYLHVQAGPSCLNLLIASPGTRAAMCSTVPRSSSRSSRNGLGASGVTVSHLVNRLPIGRCIIDSVYSLFTLLFFTITCTLAYRVSILYSTVRFSRMDTSVFGDSEGLTAVQCVPYGSYGPYAHITFMRSAREVRGDSEEIDNFVWALVVALA